MTRLSGSSGLFLFATCIVLGQSTGSVSGTIQDDSGQPVAGGYAVASPVGSSATHLTYTAMTSANGEFNLTGMQPGRYSICVQVPAGPHLDRCRWSSAVQVTVAPGHPVTNQVISVTKGSILQVRIDDPNKLLATGGPGDLLAGVFLPSALFQPLRLVASDASGRTYETAIPFNTSVRLSVTSAHLVLADEGGARLVPVSASSSGSAVVPVLSATGTANSLVTFTVIGKKQAVYEERRAHDAVSNEPKPILGSNFRSTQGDKTARSREEGQNEASTLGGNSCMHTDEE